MKSKTKLGCAIATSAIALVALGGQVLHANNDQLALSENLPEANVSDGFAELVAAIQPAVVSITVESNVTPISGNLNQRFQSPQAEEFFKRFFGDNFNGQLQPSQPQSSPRAKGMGSGFIVDSEGHVVTNYHVVKDAADIEITLSDGSNVNATLVGADPKTDLALLAIEQEGEYPFVAFGDSAGAEIGDWVIAIGNPFGLGGTTTKGIISARGRTLNAGPLDDYIQIDAPINRGNSGGPLFNLKGEVIGVNSAIYSPNGGNVGIGFAIPSSMAEHVVDQIRDTGSVQRGFIGVNIQMVTDEIAESLGLPDAKGALVTEVVSGGPADGAELESGDVILKFDGKKIEKMRDLPKVVATTEIGEKVNVVVWRNNTKLTLGIKVGESVEEQVAANVDENSESGKLGFNLSKLDSNTKSKLKLPKDQEGVLVSEVKQNSLAARSGITRGEIITKIGKKDVTTPQQIDTAIAEAKKKDKNSVLFLVKNGERSRFIALPLEEKVG